MLPPGGMPMPPQGGGMPDLSQLGGMNDVPGFDPTKFKLPKNPKNN
jgi:signal recognition particle subunit SRP54